MADKPSPFPNVPTTPTTPVASTPQAPVVNPGQRQRGNQLGIDPRYRFRRTQAIYRRIFYDSIRPGAIITFEYTNRQHDPYPLVLSTGRWLTGKMAGVNLHYLTFNYIKNLLNQFCGKNFSYQMIKGNPFIKNSFRCYKREGMRNLRLLDCEFLVNSLSQLRSFNPTEVAAMRQWIREQLQRKLNQPDASELLDQQTSGVFGQFSDIINPNFNSGRYSKAGVPQGFNLPGNKPTGGNPSS